MITRIRNLFRRAVEHHGLRKYGANMSWLFAEKLLRMAIGFTVGVYVARQLGPERYGTLNYAISFVSLFAVIAGLGLDVPVIRELVREPHRRDELLGTTFILKLGGLILMSGVMGSILIFHHELPAVKWMIWIIAAGYLFQLLQVIDFYFQAEVKGRYIAIPQIIALLICSGLRLYLAHAQAPLINFALVEMLFMMLSGSGYVYFYVKSGLKPWRWQWHRETGKYLLLCAWPLALSSLAISIQMQLDLVMLKWLHSTEEVGYYSAAVRLLMLWYFVPVIIGGSIFPAIVNARKISSSLYFKRLRRFFALMIWSGILIAGVMSAGSPFIIKSLYGNAYEKSATIMMLSAWGIVLVFFGSARGRWLNAENRNAQLLVCAAFGAISNASLNYFLIPRMGGVGSAIASISGFAVSFLIMPLFFNRSRISTMLFFAPLFRLRKCLK